MPDKRYYRTPEVAEMLNVSASALRWWESVFPMLKPKRTAGGRRIYSPQDVELAGLIKELLHNKGMKTETAIDYLNKTYRKYPPRNPRVCRSAEAAIALLGEVKLTQTDEHTIAKIEAVIGFLKGCV